MTNGTKTGQCGGIEPLEDPREAVLVFLALTALLTYHLYFTKYLDASVYGWGKKMREKWVQKFMSEEKFGILVVQTMRNEILFVSFLGETSFAAMTVIISVSAAMDVTCTLRELEKWDPISGGHFTFVGPMFKISIICGLLAGIFMSSLQALRLQKNIGLYGGCNDTPIRAEISAAMQEMVHKCYMMQFISQRLLYHTFAIVGWLLGPSCLLFSSLLCVLYMSKVDVLQGGNNSREAMRVEKEFDDGRELLSNDVLREGATNANDR